MKNDHAKEKLLKKILQGRAAIVGTVAVTVFLCLFTLFEFTALYLEWEIPVLSVLTQGQENWFTGDWAREIALDDSGENELMASGETTLGTSVQKTNTAAMEDLVGLEEREWVDSKRIDAREEIEAGAKETGETETAKTEAEGKKTDESGVAENNAAEEKTAQETNQVEYPYYIRINRKQNCITIYTMDEEGAYTVPYKAMICSTGLYNATPEGIFQISDKYRWRALYGNVYGQYATRICGGVLFHSVPYYKKEKDTLCTEKYNKLGQQASMGCVRLTTEDAKWIVDNCPTGTTVEIYDDDDPGPLGKPEAQKIDTSDSRKGWDPTDPDEKNPWKAQEDEE